MSADEYFAAIRTFRVPPNLVQETLRVLRREGRGRTESIVFWAGRLVGPDAEIHTVVVPRGDGVEVHRTHVRIDVATMARVADLVNPPDSVLLAQVHTHEGSAFHSEVDDVYGFHSPGFMSIVVPRFGVTSHDASDWAHFECLGDARVRPVYNSEILERFVVHPALPLAVREVARD